MEIKILQEDSSPIFTGQQIADMVGMGDIYRKGKEELERDNELKEDIMSRFKNMAERIEKAPRGMSTTHELKTRGLAKAQVD